ncbi:MAG: hypothetical protein WA594_07880 [Candidatus Sulfotelmatobacter sp.]
MSIKLLAASVNPVDPSQAPDGSTSLVPVAQRAIATRAGQISVVRSADVFAWSSSTRRGEAPFLHGTLVEDSQNEGTQNDDTQSDDTGRSGWQYVSGLAWSGLVESTAIAHYLFSAANPASWSGRLIDLYA